MTTRHLRAQKRMAMELMKVGRRGVWLDPECKDQLALAKSRAQIRELIEKGVIRRTAPRHRQPFVMPPQYMSRFRQRLLCDPAVRYKPHERKAKPSSGKRFFDPKYWVRKIPVEEPPAEGGEAEQQVVKKD